MSSESSTTPHVDALIDQPPVSEPLTTIERDGSGLVITTRREAKSRIPPGVVTAFAIFLGASFLCPGLFVVALIVVPVLLLLFIGLYLFAPHVLKHPADCQKLVITPDEVQLIDPPPAPDGEAHDDHEPAPVQTIRRGDITSARLVEPTREEPNGAIRVETSSHDPVFFGRPLTAEPLRQSSDDIRGELEWIVDVINAYLGQFDTSG